MTVLKAAQKMPNIFATFEKKICHLGLSKIVKSGHTEQKEQEKRIKIGVKKREVVVEKLP